MTMNSTLQIVLVVVLVVEFIALFVLLGTDTGGCRDRVHHHVEHFLGKKRLGNNHNKDEDDHKPQHKKPIQIQAYKDTKEYV